MKLLSKSLLKNSQLNTAARTSNNPHVHTAGRQLEKVAITACKRQPEPLKLQGARPEAFTQTGPTAAVPDLQANHLCDWI